MRLESIIACIALSPLLIGAAEPLRLQPSTPWGVDYADSSCRLVRTFGQGNDQTQFVLESIAPGEMSMTAIGNPLRADMSPVGDTRIDARFVPGQDNWFFVIAAKSEQGGPPAGLWTHVPLKPILNTNGVKVVSVVRNKSTERPPPIDLSKRATELADRQAFAAKISELEIQTRRGHPFFLETGSLSDPLKVFDQCMRDLIRSWGVDPDVQDRIVRPAWIADIGALLSSTVFPESALRKGEESVVTFRLLIDATGKVVKCESFSPYNAPEYNTAACGALKRGRFAPAELADGSKVPSYYANTVRYKIAA